MSHFTVLVIGDNLDAQLQPYHEFECTGTNDQYVQDIDVTDECLEEGLDWHGLEDKKVLNESEVDREETHKFGYALVDAEGNLLKAINRTNPNKKWDWWVVGGRWSGFFKLKPGGTGQSGKRSWANKDEPTDATRCDVATKGDIDFEGMRDEEGQRAADAYDRAAAIHQNEPWLDWQTVRDAHADLEAARTFYADQAPIARMRADHDFNTSHIFSGFDQYQMPRDRFIQSARDQAIATYAIVKDGVWYAKGEMGWFGMSTEGMSQDEWNAKVNEMLDALPDDTMLTLVDCHI